MKHVLVVGMLFVMLCGPLSAAPAGLASAVARIRARHAARMQMGISIVHIESGERVDIDADRPYPLASVFKLPIMIELASQIQHGQKGLSLSTELTLQADSRCIGNGHLKDAPVGTQVTLARAVELMETVSDNTATDLVFNAIGLDSVNQMMHGLGFTHSNIYLTNRAAYLISLALGSEFHGDGPEQIVSHWTSLSQDQKEASARRIVAENRGLSLARFQAVESASESRPYLADRMVAEVTDNVAPPADIAGLLMKLYQGDLLDPHWTQYCMGVLSRQQYNSRIPRLLPPGTKVYHKTGTIEGIVNDAGIIEIGPDNHVVVVVLIKRIASGAESAAGTAIAEVAKAAYDAWR